MTSIAHSPVWIPTGPLLPFGSNDRFQRLLVDGTWSIQISRKPTQLDVLTCFLRFLPPFPLFVAALATCFALLMAAFLMLSLPFMLPSRAAKPCGSRCWSDRR